MTSESSGNNNKRRSSIPANAGAANAGNWEARVLEKIAKRIEAVLPPAADTQRNGAVYGWEDRSLNHLAKRLRRKRPR